jgi:hypothetical protein
LSGDLEIIQIEFVKTREIVARWPEGVEQRRTEPQGGR